VLSFDTENVNEFLLVLIFDTNIYGLPRFGGGAKGRCATKMDDSLIQKRKERARRAAVLRGLDSAMRDSYTLIDKLIDGESISLRDNWTEMSDYSWRRARSMLIAIGVLDKRGRLRIDPYLAADILAAEYDKQSKLVRDGRTPAYLEYKSYGKRGRIKR
jgi:hypothetical protein